MSSGEMIRKSSTVIGVLNSQSSLSSPQRTELNGAPHYLPDQLRFLSSVASKILLCLLNSRKGDIAATYNSLVEATALGRTSVYKGLRELQVNRLLWVVEVRNSLGQVTGIRLRVQIPPEYFPPEAYASKRDELEGQRQRARFDISRLREEITRKETEIARLDRELSVLDRVARLRAEQTGS